MMKKKVEMTESDDAHVRETQLCRLRNSLFMATSFSLGYSTYQGLATSALLSQESVTIWIPLLISVLVALLYIPSHVMSGYLIGLQLSRRTVLNENIHAIVILTTPILFRTCFLFQLFFWAGKQEHRFLGWVVTSVLISVVFAYYIRHIKKKLPIEYLESAGYSTLLGYIPIVDQVG
eukprot:CRZ03436.1 hypothetical protein [Spongospora subterranea]